MPDRARTRRQPAAAWVAAAALALLPAQAVALARGGAVDDLLGLAASSSLREVAPAAGALPADAVGPLDQVDAEVVADGVAGTSSARDAGPGDLLARRADQEREREAGEDPAYEAFAERWPAQAAATQDVREPATTRWALLVGINLHRGAVRDNVGSAQDAVDLAEHLLAQGWRRDHIVLMTDYDATRDNIAAGMTWLARKATGDSVVVFHYSGHSKKWYGQDHDGDGEVTDEGLWPTDDRFLPDSEVASRLAAVRAGRSWVNIGACNARGFDDAGMDQPGRLITWSSREDQKSYEDPSVDNSVWGYYLFQEAMLDGHGDLDGDGEVTVEEAFRFAAPRAERRTEGQRHGVQSAQVLDRAEGPFSLRIPPPPPPRHEGDPGEDPEPEPEGGLLCPLVCDETRRPA